MNPREALEKALQRAAAGVVPHQPGLVIEKCPPDIREALKRLTSDDAANTRYPKP